MTDDPTIGMTTCPQGHVVPTSAITIRDGYQVCPVCDTAEAAWAPPYPLPPAVPSNRRRRAAYIVGSTVAVTVVVILALVLAGSGGRVHPTGTPILPTANNSQQTAPQATSAPVGTGFLATGTNYVDFMQWTNTNGALSGSAQVVYATGTPPEQTTSNQTIPISGTIHGSAISISFGSQPASFGTISGGDITIDFPQSDGTLPPITFHTASAADFNTAVAILQSGIGTTNSNTAAEQAQAKAAKAVDDDVSAVNTDLGWLAHDQQLLPSEPSQESTEVQHAAQDLTNTQKASDATIAEAHQYPDGNDGHVCSDAAGVSSDASGVSSDAAGVESDAVGISGDLGTVRHRIDTTNTDFAKLQQDMGGAPGYVPAGTPTQAQITAQESQLQSEISSIVAATNGLIEKGNGMVVTAYQYANQATQAGNCGSPESPPTPQDHIS